MNVRLTEKQKITILNSADIYKVMQQVLLRENKIRRSQEHFWVIGLDSKNKILFIELIGLGRVNRVGASPPDVFRVAIYKSAVKIVLVHNHPSGNTEFSDADIDFTDRILKVGMLIDIEVLDHMVITEKEYACFEGEGIMKKLRNSPTYTLLEQADLKKQQWDMNIKVDKAIKEDRIKVARKLKDQGMTNAQIKEITGLTLWDIKKL